MTPEERKQRREERKRETKRRHESLPHFLVRDGEMNISMDAGEETRLEVCIAPKYVSRVQKEFETSAKYRPFAFYLSDLIELSELIEGLVARYNEKVRAMNGRTAAIKIELADPMSAGNL